MKKVICFILSVILCLSFTAFCATIPNTQVVAGESDNNPPVNLTYTNGMCVQGAQVRTTGTMGLRFVGIINETMLTELENEGAKNIEYGFLVITGNNTNLTFENGTIVKANNLFATSEETSGDYLKFTACVVDIPKAKYKSNITVRTYLRYKDSENNKVTLYSTHYSANLYSVAKTAYNSGNETTAVKNYLLNNILYVANPDFPDEYTGGIYKP